MIETIKVSPDVGWCYLARMSWEPVRGPRPSPPFGEFFLTRAGEMEVVLWGTWTRNKYTQTEGQRCWCGLIPPSKESSELDSTMFSDCYNINISSVMVWQNKDSDTFTYGWWSAEFSALKQCQLANSIVKHLSWLRKSQQSLIKNKIVGRQVKHFTSCYVFSR